MLFLEIIFWLCTLFVAHSYVIFPLILKILSVSKKQNTIVYSLTDDLPEVHVMMSVYNAAGVLEQKLESMFATSYPLNKIHIWIGSDHSTDQTPVIIENFSQRYANIHYISYPERRGKSQVLNDLHHTIQQTKPADNAILVLTDASVFFTEGTFYELVKHFKNEKIGLVGANIIPPNYVKDGISFQEKMYAEREVLIKYREGLIWGTVMGVWGTCYAIRNSVYVAIPKNHLVDDFFVTLKILEKKRAAIYELNAVCYQDVPNDSKIEFRRKIRISTGNFQNMAIFGKLLLNPFSAIAFCFWSHKIFRWFTCFFILITLLISLTLSFNNSFYAWVFLLEILGLLTPLVNLLLSKLHIHNKLLRFVAHFYVMNLAMMIGFLRYLRGGNNGVWAPTPR